MEGSCSTREAEASHLRRLRPHSSGVSPKLLEEFGPELVSEELVHALGICLLLHLQDAVLAGDLLSQGALHARLLPLHGNHLLARLLLLFGVGVILQAVNVFFGLVLFCLGQLLPRYHHALLPRGTLEIAAAAPAGPHRGASPRSCAAAGSSDSRGRVVGSRSWAKHPAAADLVEEGITGVVPQLVLVSFHLCQRVQLLLPLLIERQLVI
mmetsp:Transcript_24360/g.72607  ORF Transcript_24360/g.72607 Transcript_24360/m.72607 type:complete len:210 (+) Transcript_24360:47-676(+)